MHAPQTDIQVTEGGLEFWFEFASTYAYLSVMRITEAANAAGVAVTWRPFLLGPIFAAQGWSDSPFNIYPAKGRYMWRDVARLAHAQGLAFDRPTTFPQNGLRAARAAYAALDVDPVKGQAFCGAVFEAQFAEDRDISETATLADALLQAGLPVTLLDRAQSDPIKAGLRAQTQRAMDLGLFGAPSFTIGQELFWGDDRLDQALSFAKDTQSTPVSEALL